MHDKNKEVLMQKYHQQLPPKYVDFCTYYVKMYKHTDKIKLNYSRSKLIIIFKR